MRKGESSRRISDIFRSVLIDGQRVFPEYARTGSAPTRMRHKIHSALTKREDEVLRQLVSGQTNKSIAAQLGIGEKTVRAHLTEIYRKLGVKSRTQALLTCLQRPT